MGYNPNEPRDKEGKWTSFDSSKALYQAASDKKGSDAIGKPPTKIGQKVMYRQIIDSGDASTVFTVIEIVPAQNWAKIRAEVDMGFFKPTYVANISDLKVVE